MPMFNRQAYKEALNAYLDTMFEFRRVSDYIRKHFKQHRSSVGTPCRVWLYKMIVETEAYKI